MVGVIAATIISCENVLPILNRLSRAVGLSYTQKIELIKVLKEYIPSCPVVFKNYEQSNTK
jgi:hypothetical protein